MLSALRRRTTLLALFVLPIAALTACGDSPTDFDSQNVRGVWVSQSAGETVYLDISSTAVAIYVGSHSTCFAHSEYAIVSTSGDVYTLSLPNTSLTADLILRRSGDRLEVRDPDDPNSVAFYNSSSEDTSQLDVCVGGGADPDLVCEDLPQIAVGDNVDGSLSSTDPTSVYGSHFDLYSLQLTAARQVTIDMASPDVDSFLVLYDADGAQIAENDDANDDTVDASLTRSLGPGCYRIEATSLFPDETGSYTLSVN